MTLVADLQAGRTALAYPMASVIRLIEEHGVNLLEADDLNLNDPKLLCQVVWAGLLHTQPDLPLADVTAAIKLQDLPTVVEALNAALGVEENPTSAAPGT